MSPESSRGRDPDFSHSKNAPVLIERLAATHPRTLGCMHGSAWQCDGATLLRALAVSIGR